MPAEESPRQARALDLLVFAVALIANCWVLKLGWQIDEVFLIPRSGAMLGVEPLPERPDDLEAYALGRAKGSIELQQYMYRPALWAVWFVALKLGGGFANAPIWHFAMLVIHGLAAIVLRRVLRASFGSKAATLGALLMAVHPGGIQAVSWIAAGGDLMGTLFMLLAARAIQAFRCRNQLKWACGAGFAVSLAILSKESSLLLAPLLVAAWFSTGHGLGLKQLKWCLATCAAGVGVAGCLRYLWIGGFRYGYLVSPAPLKDRIDAVDRLAGQWLAPWNHHRDFADIPPLSGSWVSSLFHDQAPMLVALIFVLSLLLPAILVKLRWKQAVVVASMILAIPLPSLLITATITRLDMMDSNAQSRLNYGLMPALSVLLAIGASLDLRGTKKGLRAAAIVVVFALSIDFDAHIARTELRAARARQDSLDAVVKASEGPARIVVLDSPWHLGYIVQLGFETSSALIPPFRREPVDSIWLSSRKNLKNVPGIDERLEGYAGRLRVLEFNGSGFQTTLDDPPFPAPMPALIPTEEKGIFRFETPLEARAIRGLRLSLDGSDDSSQGIPRVELHGTQGIVASVDLPVSAREAGSLVVTPGNSLWWLNAPPIVGIGVVGLKTSGPPLALSQLPNIDWVDPPARSKVSVNAGETLAFRTESETPLLVLEIRFLGETPDPEQVTVTLPWSALTKNEDLWRLRLDRDIASRLVVDNGDMLHAALLRIAKKREDGSTITVVDVRISTSRVGAPNIEARSPWRRFYVALDAGGL